MSYGAHKLEQINDLANASMGTGALLCIKYRHCKIVPLKQESQRRQIPADVILHHKPKFWAKKRVGRDNEELPLASVYGLLGRYLLGSFIHRKLRSIDSIFLFDSSSFISKLPISLVLGASR